MKRNRIELLCWVVAGIMALTLVGQYVVYRTAPITAYGHASWAFHPTTFAEVIAQSDSVIVGEVTKIEAGPPIVVPAKGEPSGQDSIPTERITVRVAGSAKGETAAGSEVVVFRTGGQVQIPAGPPQTGAVDPGKGTERLPEPAGSKAGADMNGKAPDRPANAGMSDAPPTANVQVLVLDEDPPYQVGQEVFLALEEGPDNTMRPVAPDGRYNVTSDGKLEAITDGAVAGSVNGRTLAEAQAAAQGLLTIPVGGPQDTGAQKREETAPGMPTTGEAATQLWFLLGGLAVALLGIGLVLRRRRA